jgi:hypothetical protein
MLVPVAVPNVIAFDMKLVLVPAVRIRLVMLLFRIVEELMVVVVKVFVPVKLLLPLNVLLPVSEAKPVPQPTQEPTTRFVMLALVIVDELTVVVVKVFVPVND